MYLPSLYHERRAYGDSQLETIKDLIASVTNPFDVVYLETATDELDQHEATDLIDISTGKRYAVRCRDISYLGPYYGQYTIRTSKGRDGLSELDKITKLGGIDYFFCYINSDERIQNWYLFRCTPQMLSEPVESIHRDGSHFNVYSIPFDSPEMIAFEENGRPR